MRSTNIITLPSFIFSQSHQRIKKFHQQDYQHYFSFTSLLLFKMSSLPKHFIIVVNGQHVTKPENDRDEIRPAQVGEKPATFELNENRLISGDWAMGCSKLEGQVPGTRTPSLAVFWFRRGQAEELYPVYLKEGDNGPQLRFACW